MMFCYELIQSCCYDLEDLLFFYDIDASDVLFEIIFF